MRENMFIQLTKQKKYSLAIVPVLGISSLQVMDSDENGIE